MLQQQLIEEVLMMTIVLAYILSLLMFAQLSRSYQLSTRLVSTASSSRSRAISSSLRSTSGLIQPGSLIPSAIVDVVESSDGVEYKMVSGVDFQAILVAHAKAVIFAVPGAFTPTCSEKHLPGFIANSDLIRSKGVDAIYCISVNDKYVMKSWGLSTADFMKSGIKMVADGNGDLAKAMGLAKDASGSRMGVRSTRFAAIVESGVLKAIEVDEKGLDKSSAETILALL